MTLIPTAPYLDVSDIGLIQGQQPASVEEWRTAVALWTFRWDFQYQVPVGGGQRRKGGTVIDFLVESRPALTALFVDGAYWHRNSQKSLDKLLRINLQRTLGREFGIEPRVVEVVASQLYNQDAANAAVLKLIGRA